MGQHSVCGVRITRTAHINERAFVSVSKFKRRDHDDMDRGLGLGGTGPEGAKFDNNLTTTPVDVRGDGDT